MSEWKEVTIGDIAILKNGKKRPSMKGPIPVYGGNGIMDTVNTYNDEDCIAIGRVGAYCGCVYLTKGKVWISDNAISAKANNNADNVFLYYLLGSLNLNRHRIGGAQPLMTQDLIGRIKISLPPIEEQHHIASILSSLDDKIAVNKKICENLEAQAQALFKHWFVDFAPFKDGKFIESELGLIPEGWRVGRLEELCSFISRGLSPKYQLGTNELVLGQTCVRNNVVTLDNAREHQPKVNCNKFVEKWDVMLNSTGIGSLGRVGIIYFNNKNVCFDSHLTVVRTAEEIYRYYVGRNLLNRQKELENMAVGSTGQTELPKKDVLVMPILIPNSDVLPEFNEIIKNIGNTIYILIEENRRLSTLRDTLLPKLMSGQIKLNEYE
jgi:type I restriction enzyme S subunit